MTDERTTGGIQRKVAVGVSIAALLGFVSWITGSILFHSESIHEVKYWKQHLKIPPDSVRMRLDAHDDEIAELKDLGRRTTDAVISIDKTLIRLDGRQERMDGRMESLEKKILER